MDKDTVLFDLDGTLLPIDFDTFLHDYFHILTLEFKDVAPADHFLKILMKSTNDMIENTGESFNNEVFMESFFSMLKTDDRQSLMKRFDRFYQEKFPQLKSGLTKNELPIQIIKLFKEADYQLVIATNPVFPLEAVTERMKWVNLNPEDFSLITHYQNMHYCKPNLDFFREITTKLAVKPENCLMIGNDMQEDMVAGKIGMETYLIEDYLIDRETEVYHPDWRGTLTQLKSYLQKKLIKAT